MAQTGAEEETWRDRRGSCAGEKAEAAATQRASAKVRSILAAVAQIASTRTGKNETEIEGGAKSK